MMSPMMSEIFKGICHITLSNIDDNALHQTCIHSFVMQRMNEDNKGEVLTAQRERAEAPKGIPLFL